MASVASQTRQESMTSSLLRKENVIRLYEAAINRRRFLDGPKFVNSNESHHLSGLCCRFFTPLRIQIWSETQYLREKRPWVAIGTVLQVKPCNAS
jgi:hypothetical protein